MKSLFPHPFIRAAEHQAATQCGGDTGCSHSNAAATLTCVRVDVPQGPRQQSSDHKRCERDAHHGECVQTMKNRCNEEKPRHALSPSASHPATRHFIHKESQKGWEVTHKTGGGHVKVTVCVVCRYFRKRKMKLSDFQEIPKSEIYFEPQTY